MRTPQAAHLEMNAAYPEFKKVRCDLQVLLTAGSYRTRGRVAKLTKREWREKCARRLSWSGELHDVGWAHNAESATV